MAAGDSLFTERQDGLVRLARERAAAALSVYDVGDLEAIKRLSAIGVDDSDRVVSFEEKPESPASTLAGIALYYFPRSVLPLVGEYLDEGNNPDQPGRFVEWLYTRVPVYAWRVPGNGSTSGRRTRSPRPSASSRTDTHSAHLRHRHVTFLRLPSEGR